MWKVTKDIRKRTLTISGQEIELSQFSEDEQIMLALKGLEQFIMNNVYYERIFTEKGINKAIQRFHFLYN